MTVTAKTAAKPDQHNHWPQQPTNPYQHTQESRAKQGERFRQSQLSPATPLPCAVQLAPPGSWSPGQSPIIYIYIT